jgi:GDPmannose 4,6-dehydratase
VTRKITRGLCNISQGLEDCLYLGNLDALRDWGHARDYVRMQWLMLQQEEPRDFVIATGEQHSVREFLVWAAEDLGIALRFEGSGVDEVGIVDSVSGIVETALAPGQVIVRVDPRYFRPAEVESLLGDPRAARDALGWEPEVTPRELCKEMVAADLASARRDALLKAHGHLPNITRES